MQAKKNLPPPTLYLRFRGPGSIGSSLINQSSLKVLWGTTRISCTAVFPSNRNLFYPFFWIAFCRSLTIVEQRLGLILYLVRQLVCWCLGLVKEQWQHVFPGHSGSWHLWFAVQKRSHVSPGFLVGISNDKTLYGNCFHIDYIMLCKWSKKTNKISASWRKS